MKYLVFLSRLFGGVSFAIVLLLLLVITPAGLFYAMIIQPMTQFATSTPLVNSGTYSYSFTAFVIINIAVLAALLLRHRSEN
ncbi:MAG: hypothetical protein ACYC56_03360 [Candidatus Aquicultor sp.]